MISKVDGGPEEVIREDVASLKRRADEAIAARGTCLGRPLAWMDDTISTNDDAKQGVREGAFHGATWVAEEQRAGRGRQGRIWMSKRGENLLFSVILRLECPPARTPLLALATGLAVRDAVAEVAPNATVGLKWPNDVLIDGKKVAGVLIETTVTGGAIGALVIGVGINTHARIFPDEITQHATSIALATGTFPDRPRLLASVLWAIERDVPGVAADGLHLICDRLAEHDVLRGSTVSSDAGSGEAMGIGDDGCLLVRGASGGGLLRWNAGEVHVKRSGCPSKPEPLEDVEN